MAKWSGKVGYVKSVEVSRGIFEEEPTERPYRGDLLENNIRVQQSSDSTNSNTNMSLDISIISDSFAIDNIAWIRYVEYKGSFWSVTNVKPGRPRIVLTIGGLYNGQKA